MSDHLLTQDDLELIQDYMLTKITFLLTKESDIQEWQFEIREQERLSEGRWEGRNAFLFGFTTARFLAAIEETQEPSESANDQPLAESPDTPVEEFVAAVRQQDSSHAEDVWNAQRSVAQAEAAAGTWTLALVSRLLRATPAAHLQDSVARLPREYEPVQFVS